LGLLKGRIISRITALLPTEKNSCGTILDGVAGRKIAVGEKVNTDDYIGKVFTVTVGPSQGDPTKTHVILVSEAAAHANGHAGPANGKAPSAKRYWYKPIEGGKPELAGEIDVQTFIDSSGKNPKVFTVLAEGEPEWQPAANYGFTSKIPF
jgi:hypothetical protein